MHAMALAPAPNADSGPDRRWLIANIVLVQAGWLACVLGAAHGLPWFGTLAMLAILAWHLSRAPRRLVELRLVAATVALGIVLDGTLLASGAVQFPNGQWFTQLTPHWMMALWAEFAMSLNVSLRWLRHRAWLAAALGAVAGPMSFLAGMRLGAVQIVHPTVALAMLALGWAVLMPLLLALSKRYDGVAQPATAEGPA